MFDYNNTKPEIQKKIASAEDTPVEVLQQVSKDSDRDRAIYEWKARYSY
jgi:hypothetical protein